ncbi:MULTISPECIES: hypothetical protein [Cytobacillus]|uniref:Uncharacterized protein n=1 Tax=Cytobacillus kochii TaxID=859143 RepID=A0A248TH64_9BACI|nr:hypothetical protein [Cytobacillus kochii]ASV67533.1 hypothetical protein CKF48_09465 [Cytobacillus kochii]
MKKFKIIKETIEKEVVEKTICNKCGDTINHTGTEFDRNEQEEEFASFSITFGYGNKRDGNTYSFDLCDICFQKMVDGLKIAPTIDEG